MKKFRFGDLLLAARAEYLECAHMLDELNKLTEVDDSDEYHHISIRLKDKIYDNAEEQLNIKLVVERERKKLQKRMDDLQHTWEPLRKLKLRFSDDENAKAYFDVVEDNGTYKYQFDDTYPSTQLVKYKPRVHIKDEKEFKEVLDELKNKPIINTKAGKFHVNMDYIYLNFGSASISSPVGLKTEVNWNGFNDTFYYYMKKNYSPELLQRVLNLEIRDDEITPEWVKIINKHTSSLTKLEVDSQNYDKSGQMKLIRDRNILRLMNKERVEDEKGRGK